MFCYNAHLRLARHLPAAHTRNGQTCRVSRMPCLLHLSRVTESLWRSGANQRTRTNKTSGNISIFAFAFVWKLEIANVHLVEYGPRQKRLRSFRTLTWLATRNASTCSGSLKWLIHESLTLPKRCQSVPPSRKPLRCARTSWAPPQSIDVFAGWSGTAHKSAKYGVWGLSTSP